jgi:hypothetical protein
MRGLELLETVAFPMKRIKFKIYMNECLLSLPILSPFHGREIYFLLGSQKAKIYLINLLMIGKNFQQA